MSPDINEYIQALLKAERFTSQIVYHTIIPQKAASYESLEAPLHQDLQKTLRQSGIKRLFSHQAKAINYIRAGQHVVCATPTASGKTLVYNLPIIEKIKSSSHVKALYLFPLKALAQDQLKNFEQLTAQIPGLSVSAKIYDGDTTHYQRKKIRDNPPNILITNPEMLHLSLLPFHDRWATFFSDLSFIVVDEVHTYRGVMGSHMAQVFRRLKRVCAYYGANPTFIFCSATVANPAQLSQQLTGLDVCGVLKSGSARGSRHIVFIDPIQSPAQTAILLLKAALHRKLRTIIYTQSRKMAELISMWAGQQSTSIAKKISAYRSGFLPQERRIIEQKLSSGELLAVVTTSALELGIDIGDLDLCILVGYPGSITSSLQRSGRVGRKGQTAAMILIAGQDALDQYFMSNPEKFFKGSPESAVINPHNPDICDGHIVCAAQELPLHVEDPYITEKSLIPVVKKLLDDGELFLSEDGQYYFSTKKQPQRDINLRGAGSRYTIFTARDRKNRGEIDGFRALKETHPGAIYLHSGKTYRVDHLDIVGEAVYVSPVRVGYYTRVRGNKTTKIISVDEMKNAWGTLAYLGRLKVTDHTTGYERWDTRSRRMLNATPLDLPPHTFETEGIWLKIPTQIQELAEDNYYHFMGGIHAMEHAIIGIFPLLVLTDRNDLGGISTTFHEQLGHAAIFVYDSTPGGAGLTRQAFQKIEDLLLNTLNIIKSCDCETGCPRCVHSPKCGSGNRPIDKGSAQYLLENIQKSKSTVKIDLDQARQKIIHDSPQEKIESKKSQKDSSITYPHEIISHVPDTQNIFYGVLDIETQRSAKDVGGWHLANKMGISCAVLYNSATNSYETYLDNQIEKLIQVMSKMELIVGFNIKRFDYMVLSGYIKMDYQKFPTLDLLEHVHKRLGYRLSLDHLGEITLGTQKSADGLQALLWWKQGKIKEIIEYCKKDVQLTKNLYVYGRQKGYVLFRNKAKQVVRLPVSW
ncbi:DEAD/DEAH box helicase [Candidatus Magnetomorum sp. HK-1]|nr:DEAD/DEAH box helicase [Candidatus Magnetomorum sp. HK-1]